MVHSRAFILGLILCGLVLTALASGKTANTKTTVTYPSAFAVSERLSDLPIELSPFSNRMMPEPRPSPLVNHATPGP